MAGGPGCVLYDCTGIDGPAVNGAGASSPVRPNSRDQRVHVFMVNGFDPLYAGAFDTTRDYVRSLGLDHVELGELYDAGRFKKMIRDIHREHADARFVLIGYSFGANVVKDMAQSLKDDGIAIDLLVYLGGDTLENTAEHRPENARRIVNVTARGCIWLLGGLVFDGEDITGAENVRLPDEGHYDVPTHPETLRLLARHLAKVVANANRSVP
jgi:hypothetical protein